MKVQFGKLLYKVAMTNANSAEAEPVKNRKSTYYYQQFLRVKRQNCNVINDTVKLPLIRKHESSLGEKNKFWKSGPVLTFQHHMLAATSIQPSGFSMT